MRVWVLVIRARLYPEMKALDSQTLIQIFNSHASI